MFLTDRLKLKSKGSLSGLLFWQGYRATMPLMVGVAAFGIFFGALAVATGMDPVQTTGMSVLVFAGSSQLIATKLIGQDASIVVIIVTTLIINLRNFLYSASLASFFQPLSKGWKWLLAYPMADEVYATIITRGRQGDLSARELAWFAVGASLNLMTIWWSTTAIGALLGNMVPAQLFELLGFTLPLIFISLIVPLLANRPALLAALSAALTGIVLDPLPHNLGLLAAALIGIGVGVWAEHKLAKPLAEAEGVIRNA
jgi:4-azaleucine resistance transporter AzlC